MALIAVDAKAAADVVGADMTVAADTGGVAMTKTDVVTTPQTHTPSDLKNDLTKMPLTAQSQALYTAMSLATGSSLMTTHIGI